MDIEIEETRDFKELARLNETVQSWHHQNYPAEFKPYNPTEIAKALQEMFLDENCFAFLAKSKEESIGYLLGFTKTRPESAFQYEKKGLYIDQIVVVEDFRKSGAGRLLLDTAFEFAKENKASEVQVDHWTGNEFAKNFFSKNGFTYFNHRMKK